MAVRRTQRAPQIASQPFSFGGGYDDTTPEHLTAGNVLVGGLNMYTDANGSAYSRTGHRTMGGAFSPDPGYGLFRFRDDPTGIEETVAVAGANLYRYDGTRFVPFTTVQLPAKLPVSGCYFPDTNAFYLTNGTDPVVKLTRSGGALIASTTTVTRSRYIAYLDRHLLFIGMPLRPDEVGISDRGADTMNSLSVEVCDGLPQGFAPLGMLSGIIPTDRRALRVTGIAQTTDSQTGTIVYGFASILDIGEGRCIAPFSIASVSNVAMWVGYDERNGIGLYRSDGQTVREIANFKLRRTLQKLDATQASLSCACPFGPYYRLAIAPAGSVGNTWEILLDTLRSDFSAAVVFQGQVGNPVFEPRHEPGFPIARFAVYRSEGVEWCIGQRSDFGSVERFSAGPGDELPFGGSLTATATTALIPALSQPFTATGDLTGLSVSLRVASPGAANLFITVEADQAGVPSGTPLATAQLPAASASTTLQSIWVPLSVNLTVGNAYHFVLREGSGSWTVGTAASGWPGSGLTQAAGVWDLLRLPLALMAFTIVPVTASLTQTTSLGSPLTKKKTLQIMVSGQSDSQTDLSFAVGTEGRDGAFTSKTLDLTGGNATWAATETDPAPSLHWAGDPTHPASNEVWGSQASDFQKTVYAPMYGPPAFYVSYQISGSGTGAWRINSYVPTFDIYPTTVA